MTSTPIRIMSSITENSDLKLSEVKTVGTNAEKLVEQKTVKKSFWRQRRKFFTDTCL